MLLIGAGLMLQSVFRLLSVDPGFDSHPLLAAAISVSGPRYREEGNVVEYVSGKYTRVLEGAVITFTGCSTIEATECPLILQSAEYAALNADECQIYTDVDGVYTTDPRIVPEARRLERITFEEMLEMASLGSKVLQIRSVEFAGKYKVKLRVLSSFDDPETTATGTLITFEEDETMEQAIISGIAFNRDEAKISVMGVEDRPGVAYAILGPVADANIDVDMIVQNIGASGHTDFSFTVNRAEYQKTLDVLTGEKGRGFTAREIIGDNKICKVSLVGIGMRSHVGIAAKMFKALADEGINIQMISTSEIKTSVVIDEKYLELAVRQLHRTFELDQAPQPA